MMSLEDSRRSQRPYRYGMVLLCVGALINWLGLAENYVEPVRYVGVACIVAGALLICAAMCCWLHAPPTRTSTHAQHANHPITAQFEESLDQSRSVLYYQDARSNVRYRKKIDDPIHVISIDEPPSGARQKPPDYEAVTDAPPSYDDAIKLNPGHLIRLSTSSTTSLSTEHTIPGTVELVPGETARTPPPPYAR
ncbi:uncharacterized protein LOC122632096 isoform X2 [Vespula pensylvanica]|uniref:uncharacterized protein LOC122632096 isoform X2 n=1 Tax=Vespula pensylvanica TaxID=30213 RepID=UPI001CBA522E|nr:uncharacterized protein LOC122632096 isoform X2 [Vespula pensylvanica]